MQVKLIIAQAPTLILQVWLFCDYKQIGDLTIDMHNIAIKPYCHLKLNSYVT